MKDTLSVGHRKETVADAAVGAASEPGGPVTCQPRVGRQAATAASKASNRNARRPKVNMAHARQAHTSLIEMGPRNPRLTLLQSEMDPVEISALHAYFPVVSRVKEQRVQVVEPLEIPARLVCLLALGPRLSERLYQGYDRRLRRDLARYAAVEELCLMSACRVSIRRLWSNKGAS